MPKRTFHNLTPEKRERVLRAAIAEFAAHDFALASLDRIADAADVPKGSLYQYFHDKEDCYAHSVRTGIERAAALFEASLARRPPRDAFELFSRALLFVLELQDEELDLARIYVRAGFLLGTAPPASSLPLLFELAGAFDERVLSWGIADGLIEPTVDRRAAAFLMDALSTRFHAKLLLDDSQYAFGSASRDELVRFVEQLAGLLRRALGPTHPPTRRTAR